MSVGTPPEGEGNHEVRNLDEFKILLTEYMEGLFEMEKSPINQYFNAFYKTGSVAEQTKAIIGVVQNIVDLGFVKLDTTELERLTQQGGNMQEEQKLSSAIGVLESIMQYPKPGDDLFPQFHQELFEERVCSELRSKSVNFFEKHFRLEGVDYLFDEENRILSIQTNPNIEIDLSRDCFLQLDGVILKTMSFLKQTRTLTKAINSYLKTSKVSKDVEDILNMQT